VRNDLEGVYTSMPAELPRSVKGRDVVVAGDGLAAALRLADWCSSVTFITTRKTRVPAPHPANLNIIYGSEIVCADGVERLESVVVRKSRTGAVSAHNASALFLLKGEQP
jgi:thioredoxin reductase